MRSVNGGQSNEAAARSKFVFAIAHKGQLRQQTLATVPLSEALTEACLDALHALESTVPTWAECDAARRRALVTEWTKRWRWRPSVEATLERYSGETPPASAPRVIGHRGSGKTARPVLHP